MPPPLEEEPLAEKSLEETSPERSPRARNLFYHRFSKNRKWLVYLGLGLLSLILVLTLGPILSHPIERLISVGENRYQQWFDQQDTTNPLVLLPLAFFGGVLASVSPCILALLPVNLSYIGTLNIKSRWDAFGKAGLFVLG
ncbi:MAG: cytochrome c biogenesis CcdA family protein, partial [Pseudanabaenaceae cyanobacterium]